MKLYKIIIAGATLLLLSIAIVPYAFAQSAAVEADPGSGQQARENAGNSNFGQMKKGFNQNFGRLNLEEQNEEALREIMKEMRQNGKTMLRFMQKNRPSIEEMREHFASMSFDEKKEKMLQNLNRALERTKNRTSELESLIGRINSAASDEDLEEIREEMSRGNQNGNGLFGNPGHGPGKPGRGPLDQDQQQESIQ